MEHILDLMHKLLHHNKANNGDAPVKSFKVSPFYKGPLMELAATGNSPATFNHNTGALFAFGVEIDFDEAQPVGEFKLNYKQ